MPNPSGCVTVSRNASKSSPGAVSEFSSGTSVEFVCSSEDILVGVLFKKCSLGDEGPKQSVVALVLGTLPGDVRISEEYSGSPLLHLGKVSKLASVVHCNSLKDLLGNL